MEALRPFGELLTRKGVIDHAIGIFEHSPVWLLEQLGLYSGELSAITCDALRWIKPYRVTRLTVDNEPCAAQGSLEEIVDLYTEQGVPQDYVRNLKRGYETACHLLFHRYPDQMDRLSRLPIRITPGSRQRDNGESCLTILAASLTNPHLIAWGCIEALDRHALRAKGVLDDVVEGVFLATEATIMFLALRPAERADYLAAVLRLEKLGLPHNPPAPLLMQAMHSEKEMEYVLWWLSEHGTVDAGDIEVFRSDYRGTDRERPSMVRVLDYVIGRCSGVGVAPSVAVRLRGLFEIAVRNLDWLADLFRKSEPDAPSHVLYRLLMTEAGNMGSSPLLILVGPVHLAARSGIADELLLLRRAPLLDISRVAADFGYLGGGGWNACSVARSVRWLKRSIPTDAYHARGTYCINICSTFDSGGFTFETAQAVRRKYQKEDKRNVYLIAQADVMDVASWNTISDSTWDHQTAVGRFSEFRPQEHEAVLNLIYHHENRVRLDPQETLERKISQRLQQAALDTALVRPVNWLEFALTLVAASALIDRMLIAPGFFDVIRIKPASVQNLLFAALFIAFDCDTERTVKELHHVMGLHDVYIAPVSFDPAILALQLGNATGREIIGQVNISDGINHYRGEQPYRLTFKCWRDLPAQQELMRTDDPEYPELAPSTRLAIRCIRRALISGMGSAFDSVLCTLMVNGVVQEIVTRDAAGYGTCMFQR